MTEQMHDRTTYARIVPLLLLGLLLFCEAATAGAAPFHAVPRLASVIAPDGRLRSMARGTFDARGWRIAADRSGAPRFLERPQTPSAVSALDDQGSWDDRFSAVGVPEGIVYAVAVDGKEIFVAGEFRRLGNVPVWNIGRWDGNAWQMLGTPEKNGVNQVVYALALVGEKLYVGGHFSEAGGVPVNNIAVWDRAAGTWSALGTGVAGEGAATVTTIVPRGSELYIGGVFSTASTLLVNNIVKYADGRFQRIGSGVAGPVLAMAFNGDYLYAGGSFLAAGGVPARRIARFSLSTSSWETVGTGVDSTVLALAPDGNDIYIGGDFTEAGGAATSRIVRWNEVDRGWHRLSRGLQDGNPVTEVNSIVVDGDQLYVGGNFSMSGYIGQYTIIDTVRAVVRYRKSNDNWERVGMGLTADKWTIPWVRTLTRIGRKLYMGGQFHFAGGSSQMTWAQVYQATGNIVDGLVEFDLDSITWAGIGNGVAGAVQTAIRYKGDIYVGGYFGSAGGVLASNIARWRDGQWYPLGTGVQDDRENYPIPPIVRTMLPVGDRLYVGGDFMKAGGKPTTCVAMWDGSAWHPLGDGAGAVGQVGALAWEGGSLYAGGRFFAIGEQKVNGIARWDGTGWSTLGSGVQVYHTPDSIDPGFVSGLLMQGELLYVVGKFNRAGGVPASNVATYNVTTGVWSALPNGPEGPVNAIVAHQGKLVMVGPFDVVGGRTARVVAYDPADGSWTTLAERSDIDIDRFNALASDGRSLYVGGNFTRLDDLSVTNIARWDGHEWHGLGEGTDWMVTSLFADSTGLLVAGEFTRVGGVSSHNVAWWRPAAVAAAQPTADERIVAGSLLGALRPNPVTSEAAIQFNLPGSSHVSIEIFSPRGERAAVLVDGRLEAGAHSAVWHADGLSSGVYRCRIVAGDRVETRAIVLAR